MMAFNWTDKTNGQDIVDAKDINKIAHEVMRLGEIMDSEGNIRIERLTKATEYTDSAIEDVETALDNIISKYGLGGESV